MLFLNDDFLQANLKPPLPRNTYNQAFVKAKSDDQVISDSDHSSIEFTDLVVSKQIKFFMFVKMLICTWLQISNYNAGIHMMRFVSVIFCWPLRYFQVTSRS